MPSSSESTYGPVVHSGERMTIHNIEDIYDHIGGMGKFQVIAVVLLYGITAAQSFSMMLMSYAGYISTFECIVHSKLDQSTSRFYTDASFNMAATDPDVENETALNVCKVNGTDCQDFKFLGSKKTAITEWNLVCDRLWLKATITSVQMFGVMLGATLGGLCGDYFGRKKTTYGPLFLHAVFNIIAAFSTSWQMFTGMRFLIGVVMGDFRLSGLPSSKVVGDRALKGSRRFQGGFLFTLPPTPRHYVGILTLNYTGTSFMDRGRLDKPEISKLVYVFLHVTLTQTPVPGQGLVLEVPYLSEFLPKGWRHVIPPLPIWQIGVIVMAGLAWWLEDWSHLHMACGALCFLFTLGCLYIPESPRWLATQGRVNESYTVFEQIARTNRRSLPYGVREVLENISKTNKVEEKGRKYTYLDLFKGKTSIKLTLVLGFQWVTMSIVSFGINFGVTSFVGDLYLNIFVMNVLQSPCLLITILVVDRLGRRLPSVIFMGVVVLISFICAGLQMSAPEHTRDVWISRLGHVSSLFGATSWGVSMVWVTESYPTVTRSLGYAFANFGARVGAVVAPFVLNLDERPFLSYIMMGAITLFSLVTILFIPETHNKPLIETMDGLERRDSKEACGNIHTLSLDMAQGKSAVKDSDTTGLQHTGGVL
ncbi:solute carrier family 22 member 21 [Plakobranchus ocellatus]|uniref:Solute carrier family 22 member 21 n=1 Tax=Plakobranchus ocellatus TaxID=259542 RepID=A0AAV4DFQ3_9GAST|nr:solute carrier family 22 member 21 [Plakobranchus ocellatus]